MGAGDARDGKQPIASLPLPSPPLPTLLSFPVSFLSFWSIAVGAAPPPLALSRPGDIKVASCLSLLRAATLQRHRPRRPRSFWEKWLPKIIKREREREREREGYSKEKTVSSGLVRPFNRPKWISYREHRRAVRIKMCYHVIAPL